MTFVNARAVIVLQVLWGCKASTANVSCISSSSKDAATKEYINPMRSYYVNCNLNDKTSS